MTVQPSPYAILQAIQDQHRATDRLITMLAGMLDKSAPDPLLDWNPPRATVEPPPRRLMADEAWQPREKPRSNRPMRRVEVGGVPVLMSEARAGMIDALRAKPCTTEDLVALGLSVSMDAVRKSFGAMNDEFEKLGIRYRIKPIERLSRIGPKGGAILPRYALVDPVAETAPPDILPAVQSEAAASASLDSEAPDSAAGDGVSIMPAQGAAFAMPSGEGSTSCVEPSPAADATKPQMNPGANVGRDHVIDLWRDTSASKLDIARMIGISRTTVANILADARSKLEPRVIAGDQTRIAAKEAAPDPRSDDPPPSVVPASPPADSTRPPAGPLEGKPIPTMKFYAHASKMPKYEYQKQPAISTASASMSVTPPPGRSGAMPIEPGDLLAVDVKQTRIQTPRGSYEVGGVNLARALDHMKGGHLFGLDVIAKKAGWPTAEVAKTALGFERARLAQHGVDLYLDKHNARLREVA